jgi:hypothetical protein
MNFQLIISIFENCINNITRFKLRQRSEDER